MDIQDLGYTVVVRDGKRYEIVRLENPWDMTEQNNGIHTEITHVIKGFPEEIALVIEGNEFHFGQFVGDTGLITHLADQSIWNECVEIIQDAIKE